MNKKERIQEILKLFHNEKILKVSDILKYFNNTIDRTTVYRYLKELVRDNQIKEIGKGIYQGIIESKEYLKQDVFERKKVGYNYDFLSSYEPNQTSFLGEGYKKIKKHCDLENLSTYNYLINIRGIENLLIDTSFASSKLEGNTYSYLDTEVLIKYNESAEGKTTAETQMILNHKNVIKYLLENRNNIEYSEMTFFDIHKLLGNNLLLPEYLGCIREKQVKIGGSTYSPLGNIHQLKEQFNIFLHKLNKINNPFEQSLFILVFIPYFQVFMDINKRTSRISCNISLLKNGLAPISLLQVKERDYIDAILAIYELNDVSLMRDIFINNYILNFERYV